MQKEMAETVETCPQNSTEYLSQQLEDKTVLCNQLSTQLFQLDCRFRQKKEDLEVLQGLYDEVKKELQDMSADNAELRRQLQQERARRESAEENGAKHEETLVQAKKSHAKACSLANSDLMQQQHVTDAQCARIGTLEAELAGARTALTKSEAELADSHAALSRSQTLEEQSRQRVAELRGQLRLWKEFGAEGFMNATDTGCEEASGEAETTCECSDIPDDLQNWFEDDDANRSGSCSPPPPLPDNVAVEITDALAVLISAPIDFGDGSCGDLIVAPWHTQQDFQDIVEAFLVKYNRTKVMSGVLVEFLTQVEKSAESFPVMLPPQQLMDIMLQFSH